MSPAILTAPDRGRLQTYCPGNGGHAMPRDHDPSRGVSGTGGPTSMDYGG